MMEFFKKLLYFGLTFLIAACQSQEQPSIAPANDAGPDQEGWNSRVTVTSRGRTAAVVQYAHMQKYNKRRTTEFDGGIVVDFYNAEGKPSSNLVAERGRLYEETNDVEAFDNVIVVSDSGFTLRTQRLRWDNARQKIVSNEFVTITTAAGDTLHGIGFEADQSLRRWSIGKPSGVTTQKIDLSQEFRPRRSRGDSSSPPAKPAAPQADSLMGDTKKTPAPDKSPPK